MSTLVTRRSLLIGIGVALTAPAIVRAESLMKVRAPALIVPPTLVETPVEPIILRWYEVLVEIGDDGVIHIGNSSWQPYPGPRVPTQELAR